MNKLKTLYRKLVDKIFGKRCACVNKKRNTVIHCVDCGTILKYK